MRKSASGVLHRAQLRQHDKINRIGSIKVLTDPITQRPHVRITIRWGLNGWNAGLAGQHFERAGVVGQHSGHHG